MTHLSADAHALLARQHGVISVAQLHAAGLTGRNIKTLEARGDLASVVRGVYRTPSVSLDELSRCAAVCLGREHAVVAGPTAGRLWGLRRIPRDQRVHVIVPPASNPSIESWVCAFRTASIDAIDIVERPDGIRLASRARTVLDLSRFIDGDDLLSVSEQAMLDGRLTLNEMYAVAQPWETTRRPWVRRYLDQLTRHLPGGPSESHAESRIGLALRDRGVHGLVRQFVLDTPQRRIRFDLAVPDLRWAIEIDIFPTHEQTVGRAEDRRRDRAALRMGWSTTRISRNEYERSFESTIRRIHSTYVTLRRRAS